MKNKVFIAQSIDGYIADENNGLEWLNMIPNPDNEDMGFTKLMESIDAILMGRNTFEVVYSFDMEWPYSKHVFVASHSLESVPDRLKDKVTLVKGSLSQILNELNDKGYRSLYIDGGKLIQSFLAEDLIDELSISTIPVVLGNGIPLFGKTSRRLEFELIESKVYLNAIVQTTYKRKR